LNLNSWFSRGITKDEYMSALDNHRQGFMNIYNNFKVPEADINLLKDKKGVRAIVLAEVWCGHCMLDIPVFLRIAEQAEIPVRFLPRDENLELMDQYLTNEKRYIPIIIFIDEEGNELAKWGPMAPEIKEYVDKLKVDVPAKDDPRYQEAFQKYVDEIGETFTTDETFWNYVYKDIKQTIPA